MHKSLLFPHTRNEYLKRNLKKKNSIDNSTGKNKILRNRLTNKEVKDLCIEKYKTVLKEIKENTSGKTYSVHYWKTY